MINTLIGQKLDQTQKFLENGTRVPVTKIALEDNVVLQIKNSDKDSYDAVQLGAGVKKKPTKAYAGHIKKLGVDKAPLKIKEVSAESSSLDEMPKSGSVITVESVFKPGDMVQVSGTSKGKGFAGAVKRHGFAGGPKTHGQSDRHRAPGSIGQGTTPGRVYKGKRMAGRMGSDTVTVKNLFVVDVDPEENVLYVSGLVPGYKNSWIYVTKTGENKKFVPLVSDKKDEEAAEVPVPVEALSEETPQVAENGAEATDEKAMAEKEEKDTASAATAADVSVSADDVLDATETVSTPSETVKTADETVSTAIEAVQAPGEEAENVDDGKEESGLADKKDTAKEEKVNG
jgi:large subunit ribosomal protein L3